MAANFVIRESKLFYTGPSAQFMRLVVLSEEQRRAVLEECHNNPGTGNHGGVRRPWTGLSWEMSEISSSRPDDPVILLMGRRRSGEG
ncbi:hypothetical protein G5714_004045 [Onychostoma macrolepis]|uniref:Uncharacterized protein n=1 Tax=Onychostoma macrolepis TaxID=369639 RepID=A0A7J6DB46_9TELE|nr:hypothetical protein G5714_004045 [Onychostoma macrolepis]